MWGTGAISIARCMSYVPLLWENYSFVDINETTELKANAKFESNVSFIFEFYFNFSIRIELISGSSEKQWQVFLPGPVTEGKTHSLQ